MNRVTVSLMDAIALVRAVVERFPSGHRGDLGNGTCYYILPDDGVLYPLMRMVPSCLIGHVFHDLGILRAMLRENGSDQYGSCGPMNDDGMAIFDNAYKMGVTFSHEAQHFLYRAQSSQDAGKTWPVALTDALVDTLERNADDV